jgi:hypothetical protein
MFLEVLQLQLLLPLPLPLLVPETFGSHEHSLRRKQVPWLANSHRKTFRQGRDLTVSVKKGTVVIEIVVIENVVVTGIVEIGNGLNVAAVIVVVIVTGAIGTVATGVVIAIAENPTLIVVKCETGQR